MDTKQKLYTALAESDDLLGDLGGFGTLPPEYIDRLIVCHNTNAELLDSITFNEKPKFTVEQYVFSGVVLAVGLWVCLGLLGVV